MVPIKDFEGYFITKQGKVYSNLGRGNRDKSKRTSLYEVRPRLGKTGYLRVYMRQNSTNKRVDRYVHRLVAEHFLPKVEGKNYVNHIDSDRSNNDVINLEWCTIKENNKHAMDYGFMTRDVLGRFIHKLS